jgi:uncharacterized surface protein with fasciclin (FAS1) repeats
MRKIMTGNYGVIFGKIVSILGLASISLSVTLPSQANPKPSIFDQPPYNRNPRPSQTQPVTSPTVNPTPSAPVTETKVAKNLIILANDNGSFKILVKALTAAGLVETLQGEGSFTIFAPSDAAFAKLPQGALQDLLKPENKEVLVKILTYHVVTGKVLSSDLKSGELRSFQGDPITVKVDRDNVQINDAKVTKADIQGSNGVIHQIDNVILPPSL